MGWMVHRHQHEGLIVGLSWSVLSSEAERLKGRALTHKIRRQGRLLGARQFALNPLPHAVHLGLYSPPVLNREKPPKQLHALALVFLAAFAQADKSTVNAILLMPAEGDDERRALVVIEGGQVVHDKLERSTDAIALVQKYRQTSGLLYTVFSHYPEVPDATAVTWAQLLANTSKASQLQALPRNVWWWLAFGSLAVAASVAMAYYHLVLAPAKERAQRLAQAARDNHTPQYLEKLSQGLARAGWNRADMLTLLQAQAQEVAYHKGWALHKVDCQLDAARCDYHFERLGGELADLVARTTDKVYDVQASNRDLAVFQKTIKPVLQPLPQAQLPSTAQAAIVLRTALQRLNDADIGQHQGPATPWPNQGIDMNKVDKNVRVQQSSQAFTLPFPLAADVLDTLPPFVGMRSFQLQLNPAGDKADMLRVSFKGHSYVQ